MNTTLAPICLFTYNRLEETKQTVDALKQNSLASESELFVFSDGPKNADTATKVQNVRNYLKTIEGFKSVTVFESETNKGLANSIIDGVTKIVNQYGKVIVLEDDLITSPNFLDFMNQNLELYQNTDVVFSISGFSVKIKPSQDYEFDNYFWGRAHSWGWGVWKNRWNTIDWQIKDYEYFKSDKSLQKEFNRFGSDLSNMLISSKEGRVNSWFIRFTYNQFKQNRLTVFPTKSKVINNGFMQEATHTNTYNRIKIEFDESNSTEFCFNHSLVIDSTIGKQVYYYKSLNYRIVGKIFTYLMRLNIIKQRKQTI